MRRFLFYSPSLQICNLFYQDKNNNHHWHVYDPITGIYSKETVLRPTIALVKGGTKSMETTNHKFTYEFKIETQKRVDNFLEWVRGNVQIYLVGRSGENINPASQKYSPSRQMFVVDLDQLIDDKISLENDITMARNKITALYVPEHMIALHNLCWKTGQNPTDLTHKNIYVHLLNYANHNPELILQTKEDIDSTVEIAILKGQKIMTIDNQPLISVSEAGVYMFDQPARRYNSTHALREVLISDESKLESLLIEIRKHDNRVITNLVETSEKEIDLDNKDNILFIEEQLDENIKGDKINQDENPDIIPNAPVLSYIEFKRKAKAVLKKASENQASDVQKANAKDTLRTLLTLISPETKPGRSWSTIKEVSVKFDEIIDDALRMYPTQLREEWYLKSINHEMYKMFEDDIIRFKK